MDSANGDDENGGRLVEVDFAQSRPREELRVNLDLRAVCWLTNGWNLARKAMANLSDKSKLYLNDFNFTKICVLGFHFPPQVCAIGA